MLNVQLVGHRADKVTMQLLLFLAFGHLYNARELEDSLPCTLICCGIGFEVLVFLADLSIRSLSSIYDSHHIGDG